MVSEKQVEAYLAKQCKAAGGMSYKFSSPSHRGVPDRICLFPGGVVVFVELKSPRGKTSALQDKTIRDMQALGAEVHIINSKEKVDAFISTYITEIPDAGE